MSINKSRIAEQAKNLQIGIWRWLKNSHPTQDPSPFNCTDPEVACRYLGVNYECISEMGDPRFTGGRITGEMNRQANKITISSRDPLGEIRFTAAHEIGHWLMHDGIKMHRDRPIYQREGFNSKAPPAETEANYFAACYLMPERLLRKEFVKRFGPTPIQINDFSAYWLGQGNPDAILRASINSMERYLAAARCCSFGDRQFQSLSKRFGVSDSAMAFRLEEFKLIKWP